jgi:hypothetical protein
MPHSLESRRQGVNAKPLGCRLAKPTTPSAGFQTGRATARSRAVRANASASCVMAGGHRPDHGARQQRRAARASRPVVLGGKLERGKPRAIRAAHRRQAGLHASHKRPTGMLHREADPAVEIVRFAEEISHHGGASFLASQPPKRQHSPTGSIYPLRRERAGNSTPPASPSGDAEPRWATPRSRLA